MNILNIEHISKIYGEKVIFDDVSLGIHSGDKIGVIGVNGTGKTTLLKIIAKINEPDKGQIICGNGIRVSYLPQNPEFPKKQSILEYVMDGKEHQDWKTESEAKTILTKLGIYDFDEGCDHLSGGQKKRVALARTLVDPTEVLILDEPTNDLDIQTLTILEDYLDTFAGIVITVSHDRYFLDRIVNRIFAFEEGGHLKQYEGGYTDYLEKVKPAAKPEKSKPAKKENNGKKFQKEHQKKLKFTYKEQKEFETIDDDIAKLEEKLEQLDEEIMENATNSGKLAELTEQKESAQAELDEKMDRWVYLNDLAEQIANQ